MILNESGDASFVMSDDDARVRRVTAAVRDACPSAAIDEAPLRAFIRSLRALSVGGGGGGGSGGGGGGDGGSESGGGSGGGGSGGRRGGGARDHLAFILDYDLTLSRGGGIECHSFFGGPGAPAASAASGPLSLPPAFRDAVSHLFAAIGDASHPDHAAVAGDPEAPGRPHRFWTVFNGLAVQHGVTRRMLRDAVAAGKAAAAAEEAEKAEEEEKVVEEEEQAQEAVGAGAVDGRRGSGGAEEGAGEPGGGGGPRRGGRGGRLLRDGVGAFLAACDAAGVPTVILSAGITQVIELALAADGVALPPSCTLLANTMVFAGEEAGADQATAAAAAAAGGAAAAEGGDGGGGGSGGGGGGGGSGASEDAPCVGWLPEGTPSSRVGKLLQLAELGDVLGGRRCAVLVGDKPVDATVAKGYPPAPAPAPASAPAPTPASAGGPGGFGLAAMPPAMPSAPPSVLTFGFLNSPAPTEELRGSYDAAFHLLAPQGRECSFAPLTALLAALLADDDDDDDGGDGEECVAVAGQKVSGCCSVA